MRTVADTQPSLVDTVLARLVAAWEKGDPDGCAEVFTEHAIYTTPGHRIFGRDAIRTMLADAFIDVYADTRLQIVVQDRRMLAPQATLVIAYGGIIPSRQQGVPDDLRVNSTWVFTGHRPTRWQIAAYHASGA